MKTILFKDIAQKYNDVIKEALKFNYLVRDSELQLEQCKILENLKTEIKNYKYQAIQQNNEFYANNFFHFQCVLNSLISSLNMWVQLKNAQYQYAWNSLIDAQEYAVVALRVEGNHFGIDELIQKYDNIENNIFPGWPVYSSIGYLEQEGVCSICNLNFSQCDHLEGFVYLGKLCRRIRTNPIKIDHTSLVEIPKDKRCIITWISTDYGKKRNYITWKITDERIKNFEANKPVMGTVMFSLKSLDFD